MDGKRVAIYVRVSTSKQSVRNQQRELEAVAKRHGWTIVAVFKDAGISGLKEQRPGFDQLKRGIIRKEFDMIAVWSTDRLARSMPQLARFLELLTEKQVHLYDHHHGIDTTTKFGEAFFYMAGIFAGIERAIIVDRIHAGLKRAKAEGKILGRPAIGAEKEAEIRHHLFDLNVSIRKTAKLAGVDPGTVMRVKKAGTPS
jgi:DNA invertase Pin-like site-specific DNA recombinase